MTKPFWTNSLPSGWQADQVRHVADIANSNVDKKSYDDGTPVRLCNYTDVYYNAYITNDMELMEATATPSEIRRFQLRPGDVIITKDSESWDDIAVPTCVNEPLDNVVCGYHLTLMRTKPNRMIGRFLLRALQAEGVREQFWLAANGVTRFGLGQQGMKSALLPVPPLSTQQTIANFLDEKTTAIDDLIAKKERLIELLEEKRAALINRAVTKGLDPDVPMKDSGIPWIGEIPEHWDLVRVGHCLKRITYGFTNPMPATDEGPWMLTAADIRMGHVDFDSARHTSFEAFSKDLTNKSRPRYGDVLITKDGTLGRVTMWESDEPACINQSVALLRSNSDIHDARFLGFALRAPCHQDRMIFEAGGSTIKHIYITRLAKMPLAWPPREERLKLLEVARGAEDKVTGALAIATRQINLLQEYRRSLITAAVTGQIQIDAASGKSA